MMSSDGHPRGRLKVFLGYAAGVGKTYQMMDEAQELKRSGHDIAIGYLEPHHRPDTLAMAEGFESTPRKAIQYRGSTFEEMDTDAILERRPEICIVDEFAHTNAPGSERLKRWEDVLVLLENGINVLTTMNVQHLESLNDQVYQITGIRVRETVPDWVVQQADEVVMVDVSPRALLHRLERGVIYPESRAERARESFFKESTLVALREMAMRQTAHEVDVRTASLDSGPEGLLSISDEPLRNTLRERVLVYITADSSSAMLIRRGKRVADFLQGDCVAVAVQKTAKPSGDAEQRKSIERHLNFARNLHVETRVLRGEDEAQTLVEFARRHQVTQIFLARTNYRAWQQWLGGNLIHRVVRLAQDMQVTIVAERRPGTA